MTLSRRTLMATASGALMTSLAPGMKASFAASGEAADRDILVVIFLRFGSDGLTMVAPSESGEYRDRRPTIGIPSSGPGAGLHVGALDRVPFFLHPMAGELKALYDAKQLAIVHAAGLPTDTRSHFESQEMMERGWLAGSTPMLGGWLTRHLMSRKDTVSELAAISAGADVHVPLHGFPGVVAIADVTQFNVVGGDFNLAVIDALNAGSEPAAVSARETVAMIRDVQKRLKALPPDGETTGYPAGEFPTAMKTLAKIVKMNAGLEVATVDFSGWDHHFEMNRQFPAHTQHLSKTLAAFWEEVKAYQKRITVVTMTEFGRRLDENTAGGTDHGAASFMFVLGGAVAGGKLYGTWPGLKPADLREGDLRVTTDVRHVLQELLVKRRGETALENVFPGIRYTPLGLVAARA